MSCNICNKQQCCCVKTVSRMGPRGPKGNDGRQGIPGINGIDGINGDAQTYFFPMEAFGVNQFPAPLSGDYILKLELYAPHEISSESSGDITSLLIKNSINQNLNVNYNHRKTPIAAGAEVTYTHTAKLTGIVAGDLIGFDVIANFMDFGNGSVTLMKIP